MKVKYDPTHLKLSLANVMATARQEAVIHPYPLVRERAHEAIDMVRRVAGMDSISKMEIVKSLRRTMQPDLKPGETLVLTMIIDAINRGELDDQSYRRTLESAKSMYLGGLASATRAKNEDEILRWQWFRDCLERLDGLTAEVNYKTLWDLSVLGVLNAHKESS